MSKIKLSKARKLSVYGRYPQTWQAIIKRIPPELQATLTASELVQVISLMQKLYGEGVVKEVETFAEHHEILGDPWMAKLTQQIAETK